MIKTDDIRRAISNLDLSGSPVCLHSSLRSFGWVEGGPSAVVDAFLSEGCTLLVFACSWVYGINAPSHLRFPRNGVSYETELFSTDGVGRVFEPHTSTEIDENMGAISAALLRREDSQRGNHPTCSFAAAGPLTDTLLKGQTATDVHNPIQALADHGGYVVLAGVGVNRMTLIHLSEERAGRLAFRRWANGPDGQPIAVAVGGHGGGFPNLEKPLFPFLRVAKVGKSDWRVYPAAEALG